MGRKIVIIGFGPAGRTAAGFASRFDRKAEITVISDRPAEIFHPCALPYTIGGKLELDDVVEDAPVRGIQLLSGTEVTKIDPDTRTVSIVGSDGEGSGIDYDVLLIATGASPIIPPVPGTDLDGVYSLTTPDDAEAIITAAGTAKKAVVVGGGAIGIETASELNHRGIDVTLVELEAHLLPGILDPDISSTVEEMLTGEGIKMVTGSGLEAITGAGRVESVVVGGEDLPADIVVISIGVRPNTDLASATGIDIGPSGGILVNEGMETSVEGIYAAGDAVDTMNLVTGVSGPMRLAGIATRQGRTAGINMAGGEASMPGALGSWIVCTRSFFAGGTGLTSTQATDSGIDAASTRMKAPLFPEYISDERVLLKVTAEKGTGRILGGQAVSVRPVNELINCIMLLVTRDVAAGELSTLDWCYAPEACDVIAPIARVAEGLIRKI